MTGVVNFAHSFRLVTVFNKILRQGYYIGHHIPEMGSQVMDPQSIRPQPGQKCISGRCTNGLLGVSPCKKDAFCGKRIYIRGDNMFCSITMKFGP